MKKLLVLLLSLLTLNIQSQKFSEFSENIAFDIGESLQYTVQYTLYLDVEVAGFILKVEEQTLKERKFYGLTAYGETYNYSDNFMKVKAGYQSIVDKRYFLPRLYIRTLKRGDLDTKKTVILAHSKNYANTKGSDHKTKINTQTRDLLSMLYLLRTQDLENVPSNSEFWINTLFSSKTWNYGFKKKGIESIKTKVGQVECIVVQPILTDQLIKELNYFKLSEDKPIISSAEQINIWFTNDSNKIPIKIESKTDFGSIIIELKKFEGLKNKNGELK
jgi:Protein of unknown function (DUF3108)